MKKVWVIFFAVVVVYYLCQGPVGFYAEDFFKSAWDSADRFINFRSTLHEEELIIGPFDVERKGGCVKVLGPDYIQPDTEIRARAKVKLLYGEGKSVWLRFLIQDDSEFNVHGQYFTNRKVVVEDAFYSCEEASNR